MEYVLIGLPVIFLLVFIGIYNAMVSVRNQCDEAWSNVDTELKRRYDLSLYTSDAADQKDNVHIGGRRII